MLRLCLIRKTFPFTIFIWMIPVLVIQIALHQPAKQETGSHWAASSLQKRMKIEREIFIDNFVRSGR